MHFCPKVPVMLVGCKKDLRRDHNTVENLHKQNQRPVTPEQVSLLAIHRLLSFDSRPWGFGVLSPSFPIC